MINQYKRTIFLLSIFNMVFSAQLCALEQGDLVIRVGITNVNPDDDSGTVGGIPDSSVTVDDGTSPGITASYMLTDNVAVGLLAAVPFSHDINGAGSLVGLGKIADAEQLPPTLTAQYFFSNQGNIRPYVGAGINYTRFFSEDATASAEAALGQTSVSLDDSWGLALEAGVDVDLKNNWLVNIAVWKLDIDTTATLDTQAAGRLTVDVDIDPWVYMLAIGKQF